MTHDTTPVTAAAGAPPAAPQYEDLLSAVNGIVWEADAATMRFTFVSDKAEEIVGYPASRWVEEPTFWVDHLHPDDRDWAMELCVANAAARRGHELDYRMLTPDGDTVWLRETVTVDVDTDDTARLRGVIVDITRQKTAEEELRRRDAILEAVRFAGERLLSPSGSWDERVQAVLERLGQATGVSRVYIFENSTGRDDEIWTTNTHVWAASPELLSTQGPELRPLSYRAMGLDRWLEAFPRGEVLYGYVRDMPEIERAEFERMDILSYVLVPTFVDGAWWGVIGFDECVRERISSRIERDALKAAADMLGAAIGRERELARRDAVLEAVRFAGDRFLAQAGSWEESIDDVLERLGQATGVSRVYLYENYTGPDGEVWASKKHKWVRAELAGQVRVSARTDIPYIAWGFQRWLDAGLRGEVLHGSIRDVPLSERQHDDPSSTTALSYVLVPILVHGAWWGFIRFDECVRERDFSAMERDALKAAADTLGAAIGRSRADEELRESQRSMQALLSNLPGMAYRSRPGSPWRVDFVSEGALDLTGYPPSRLAGNADFSFVDLIHPDDRGAIQRDIEAAIAATRPFHLTYRIRTKDDTEKWVLEQGRAVHDTAGTVVALEGIVIDVTERIQSRQILEQRVEERTRELATLLEIARNVGATLELAPLLGLILDELKAAVDYHGAGILIQQHGVLVQAAGRGPLPERTAEGITVSLADARLIREILDRGEPLVVGDVWADDPLAREYRHVVSERWLRDRPYVRSWAGVPLQVRNRTLGMMVVAYAEPNHFTARDVELLTAVAAQAAVAIENARLYEAAADSAALEERQRLARELHDSVSQALFGIGLGARTARTLLDQDPAKAVAPIDYVLSLAEAGLAEMRALIFELRPEALAQEGLVAALKKQAAAMRARYGIAVEASLPAAIEAPQPVQEAIYRIAQEALHNIVKHARATTVSVEVAGEGGVTTLRIVDDGVGFDPGGSFPGHLGLRSMAERAEKLGGALAIASARGEGTTIRVSIPNAAT